ncbi:MAG: SDR family oxidoreductase [Ferruginibacter sp.]|nr:SDR family oxidoreductase [Ferruginibacter sp.]
MNITIFGATGMVGKELVKQALHNGHQVKAFGRNVFTEDLPKDDNLELIQGALFDEGQVLKAIKGSDAVLSALGGAITDADVTRSLGMKNIVAQMEKAGVKRIVALGGMGSLNADEDTLVLDTPDYPSAFFHVSKEHYKAYEFLKASNLDWTFVCPGDIINAEATGHFVTNADYLPTPNNSKITSGDLALFMLNQVSKTDYIDKRVGISN